MIEVEYIFGILDRIDKKFVKKNLWEELEG